MASKSKGHRIIVKFINKKTGTFYTSYKNRNNTKDKLTIHKYDKKTRKHEEFEEVKI